MKVLHPGSTYCSWGDRPLPLPILPPSVRMWRYVPTKHVTNRDRRAARNHSPRLVGVIGDVQALTIAFEVHQAGLRR